MTLVSCLALILPSAAQATAWHLPDWQARAVIEVAAASADRCADVAGARVLSLGRSKPDGADYRVVDAEGKPVPFKLMWHDAARYSLIAFAASATGQPYYIYFQNPQAAAVANDWEPRCGLAYETMERPAGPNPNSIEEMRALIAGSPRSHGARWQRRIADGFNPFGPSDYFISVYRGWLAAPRAGQYEFCNASNEASFSFLNGRELVHWPGRHTEERGARGEKSATVELTAGLHYVEYYHEEVTLQQVTFLGWRAPGMARCWSIPESAWTMPRAATVARYEGRTRELPVFEPVIVDSIWPAGRADAQYTRVRFTANQVGAWSFGDGQTATDQVVEHVYLTTGRYEVVCNDARWPVDVYEIQHVYDGQPAGKLAEYRPLIRGYDALALPAAARVEWRAVLAESADDFAWLLEHEPQPERKLAWLARLIGAAPARASELAAQAETIARAARKTDAVYAAYRLSLAAAGDAELWAGRTAEARELLQRAEAVANQPVPLAVRVARTGSYPHAVREHLERKDFASALRVVDDWEQTFPTEKLRGHSLYWRGRALAAQGDKPGAARQLVKALELAPGAIWEREAEQLLKEVKE